MRTLLEFSLTLVLECRRNLRGEICGALINAKFAMLSLDEWRGMSALIMLDVVFDLARTLLPTQRGQNLPFLSAVILFFFPLGRFCFTLVKALNQCSLVLIWRPTLLFHSRWTKSCGVLKGDFCQSTWAGLTVSCAMVARVELCLSLTPRSSAVPSLSSTLLEQH